MSKVKLYRIHPQVDRTGGLAQKFPKLLQEAGLADIVKQGDLVAVKMHFGEPGNLRYTRPAFPVMVVDALLELGAKPFVTDTAVLYKSPRHHAWDYYLAAKRHGFTSEVLGCPLIIAGGMTDLSVKVKVPGAKRLQEVGIAQEIYDADVLISLAHVTLHLQYPLGASIKNVAMGCADIPTKTAMHDIRTTKPRLVGQYQATMDVAKAVLSGFEKKFFGINLLLDVTPDCDCWNKSDVPIVPDLGILAGTDPNGLDQASYDLITAAPGYPGSKLDGTDGAVAGGNKVTPIYPNIDCKAYFDIANQSKLGNPDYEIVTIS
ncbi:hypothetical protein CEE37_14295 [candidate division LCP-89 bacterium B3_LCP]|uniref:DUF362 domain-containing protein n=1 Tax=candidate division LCP-89 bacterium B3_LCP TaxID=2012998 RepID=A0A532UQQ6_UNCL8|nr:MAG: hypothetical protein CEE37_14295 [candidate division LCP-89 bacterium B3_LCP]